MQAIINHVGKLKNYKIDATSDSIITIHNKISSETCYNCYIDSSGRSSGRYNNETGTDFFETGSICPICKGRGEIDTFDILSISCKSKKMITQKVKEVYGLSEDTEFMVFIKNADLSIDVLRRRDTQYYLDGDFVSMIGFLDDKNGNNFRLEFKGV